MFSLGFMVYNNHSCPWLGVGYLLLIAWVSHELEVDKGSKGECYYTVENQEGASR